MEAPGMARVRPAVGIPQLMFYFGLVYFSQGIGQAGGLINQPVLNYFSKTLGLSASQATGYLAVLTLPWVIKPLYGLISDFIPLFGTRRKSYLLILNALATFGFLWLTGLRAPGLIIAALLLTAFGIAFSDVLVDALMVENGQRTGLLNQFQGQQWLWFNVALIASSLAGGYLCRVLAPAAALHTAALLAAAAPAAVVLATGVVIREPRAKLDLSQLRTTARSLLAALRSPQLWIVAGFLVFWNFSPSFGTPLYYYMSNRLKFDQGFIGMVGALEAGGAVLGAIAFKRWLAPRLGTLALLRLTIGLGVIGTLAYLFLKDRPSAIVLSLAIGAAGMVTHLTLLGLAGAACPRRAEAFTFAALMSLVNLAKQGSALLGAALFDHLFRQQLAPLIWVSALFTLASFALLRFLPREP